MYTKEQEARIAYNQGAVDKIPDARFLWYNGNRGGMGYHGTAKWSNEYGNSGFIRIDSRKSLASKNYWRMMRLRKIWAEGSFSVLKREHCLSKVRKRGIQAVTEECLLSVMALN